MKKYIIFSAAVLAMAFTSCQKDPKPQPEAEIAYCVASYDTLEYELSGGRQRTISLYIKSEECASGSSDVIFNIGADENLVDDFNAGRTEPATMLPDTAYALDVTSLTVFKNNTKSLSSSVKLKVKHNMQDGLYVLPINITTIIGSESAIPSNEPAVYIVLRKLPSTKGKGTENEPYLISTAQDLMDMHEYCRSTSEIAAEMGGDGTVYFKMLADVDLGMKEGDNNDWEPINPSGEYDKKVNFNGNGKTIKNLVSQYYNYSSFLGVVYGEVYNVTFEDPVITGESAIGTVGGYGGTSSSGGRTAYLHNVHVKRGKIIQYPSENKGVGGLIGRMYGSKIEACSFDGYIESSYNMIGGIIGQDTKLPCEIVNCSSSGKIYIIKGQRAGGIAGCLTIAGSSVKNCISTMSVSGRLAAGGIVGHANLDSSSEKAPYNVFQKCIAWNDNIDAVSGDITSYSSGAVVGFGAATNTCEDCYYKRGMKVVYKSDELNEYFKVVDQPNCSKSNPQTVGVEYVTSGSNKRYKLPYHGKSSEEGQTASQIATLLGWDTNVWDLSGAIPVLK